MIINICYCKNILFKGTHLYKTNLIKSFIPISKLYLIKQSWLLDLINKIFYFDLNLFALVSTTSNLGFIYCFVVMWYHGILLIVIRNTLKILRANTKNKKMKVLQANNHTHRIITNKAVFTLIHLYL